MALYVKGWEGLDFIGECRAEVNLNYLQLTEKVEFKQRVMLLQVPAIKQGCS